MIPHPDWAPLGYTAVAEAAGRVWGTALRTPLVTNPELDAQAGARLLIKPENLQRTGSFKIRGAFNHIASLPPEVRRNGVVAYSSGNHAQGVAYAAQAMNVPAVIVMPADAPATKIERTRALGAEVQQYDRFFECRERIGAELAEDRGASVVKPYDDPAVIAGQGTVGLELLQQAAAQGTQVDAILVCAGGGGLTAGVVLATRGLSPNTRVYTVEPADLDDHAKSFETGARVRNAPDTWSMCDALLAPTPGERTFAINQGRVAGGIAVTDEDVGGAMLSAYRELKLVLEPGGAVALAAALTGQLPPDVRTVGVILSGGNVDPATYAAILTRSSYLTDRVSSRRNHCLTW